MFLTPPHNSTVTGRIFRHHFVIKPIQSQSSNQVYDPWLKQLADICFYNPITSSNQPIFKHPRSFCYLLGYYPPRPRQNTRLIVAVHTLQETRSDYIGDMLLFERLVISFINFQQGLSIMQKCSLSFLDGHLFTFLKGTGHYRLLLKIIVEKLFTW